MLGPGPHRIADLIEALARVLGSNHLLAPADLVAAANDVPIVLQTKIDASAAEAEAIVAELAATRGLIATPVAAAHGIWEWVALNGPRRAVIAERTTYVPLERVFALAPLHRHVTTMVPIAAQSIPLLPSLRPFFSQQSGAPLMSGSLGPHVIWVSGLADEVAFALDLVFAVQGQGGELPRETAQALSRLDARVRALEGGGDPNVARVRRKNLTLAAGRHEIAKLIDESARLLERNHVCAAAELAAATKHEVVVAASAELDPAGYEAVVTQLLGECGLVLTSAGPNARVWEVVAVRGKRREVIGTRAWFVAPEQVSAHAAFRRQVVTRLKLKPESVAAVIGQIRGAMSSLPPDDAGMLCFGTVGNAWLLLGGWANQIDGLLQNARETDGQAATPDRAPAARPSMLARLSALEASAATSKPPAAGPRFPLAAGPHRLDELVESSARFLKRSFKTGGNLLAEAEARTGGPLRTQCLLELDTAGCEEVVAGLLDSRGIALLPPRGAEEPWECCATDAVLSGGRLVKVAPQDVARHAELARHVTTVLELKQLEPSEAVNALRPLATRAFTLSVRPSNALELKGSASQVLVALQLLAAGEREQPASRPASEQGLGELEARIDALEARRRSVK